MLSKEKEIEWFTCYININTNMVFMLTISLICVDTSNLNKPTRVTQNSKSLIDNTYTHFSFNVEYCSTGTIIMDFFWPLIYFLLLNKNLYYIISQNQSWSESFD